MQIMLSVSAAVYALTMDPYGVCVTPTTSIYTASEVWPIQPQVWYRSQTDTLVPPDSGGRGPS